MPNRVEFDIQGTSYTLPINPIEYQSQDSFQHGTSASIMTGNTLIPSHYDDRGRVMTWRNLPNKSNYNTMYKTLRDAILLSGVRINHRDLNYAGDQNEWSPIMIDNVHRKKRKGAGSREGTSNINFDMDLVFRYI